MNSKQKEQYLPPTIEVIEMQTEGGVMSSSATSGSISTPDVGNEDISFSSTRRSTYNGASSSELEDLINDILTIEQ